MKKSNLIKTIFISIFFIIFFIIFFACDTDNSIPADNSTQESEKETSDTNDIEKPVTKIESVSISPKTSEIDLIISFSVEENGWTDANLQLPEIKYKGREATVYDESLVPPVEKGKYTAFISIEGKSVSFDFEL